MAENVDNAVILHKLKGAVDLKDFGSIFWGLFPKQMNLVLEQLNNGNPNKLSRVRFEEEERRIYCLIFRDKLWGCDRWVLCKVGLSENNLEELKRELELESKITSKEGSSVKNLEDSLIFRLSVTETRRLSDVESIVRAKLGCQVEEQSAKKLNLAHHTEWVLTTRKYIDYVKHEYKERRENLSWATTDVIALEKNIQSFNEYMLDDTKTLSMHALLKKIKDEDPPPSWFDISLGVENMLWVSEQKTQINQEKEVTHSESVHGGKEPV